MPNYMSYSVPYSTAYDIDEPCDCHASAAALCLRVCVLPVRGSRNPEPLPKAGGLLDKVEGRPKHNGPVDGLSFGSGWVLLTIAADGTVPIYSVLSISE